MKNSGIRQSQLFFCVFLLAFLTITFLLFAQPNGLFEKRIGHSSYSDGYSPDLQKKTEHNKIIAQKEIVPSEEEMFPEVTAKSRFLASTFEQGWCGGLANQMWRFASMYGISKILGLSNFAIDESSNCDNKNAPKEIENTFPMMGRHLIYFKPTEENSDHLYGFADSCCHFDDPKRLDLSKFTKRYLLMGGPPNQFIGGPSQHFRFFHERRNEIRKIFEFSPEIRKSVAEKAQKIFGAKIATHKFCVHTRLGDFAAEAHLHPPTSMEFASKATIHLTNRLKQKYGDIFVVLLGEEKGFLKNLSGQIQEKINSQIFVPEAMNRGEDMCFAISNCDSFLITAHASTYAWWIAYLLERRDGEEEVFYDGDFKNDVLYYRGNFLDEWKAIVLNKKDGLIYELV